MYILFFGIYEDTRMELAWNRLTRQERDGCERGWWRIGANQSGGRPRKKGFEEGSIGIEASRGRTLTIGRGGGAAWRGAPAPIVLSTN